MEDLPMKAGSRILFSLVTVVGCLGAVAAPSAAQAPIAKMPDDEKRSPWPKPEIAMLPGTRIEVTNRAGKMVVTAVDDVTRSYTWEGATRSEQLSPRVKRWDGSLGLFCPGPGDHWEEHNGITRACLEEGQLHFKSTQEALTWLKERRESMDYVYRDDGLVVGWDKNLSRDQLDVEVWQFLIQGKKPTRLEGSRSDKIEVTQVEPDSSELVRAVKKHEVRAVMALLKTGLDSKVKDCTGRPALTIAAGMEVVAELQVVHDLLVILTHRQRWEILGEALRDLKSALAAKRESADIVKALVIRGADVNAKDSTGCTALFFCTQSTARILLSAGADPNAKIQTRKGDLLYGITPIFFAADSGDLARVKLLLEHGARADVLALHAGFPFEGAKEFPEVVKLLKAAMK
jgi:hypothetical protein